jgi:SAM-dependent methyltransferase
MKQFDKIMTLFEEQVDTYENWFHEHPKILETEALAFRTLLPVGEIKGIEVGMGAGHLAKAIGIHEGVEPSEVLRKEAIKKGLEVSDGRAEDLPFKDLKFDFVIIGTALHYFENPDKAFSEAFRVLKKNGVLILGFLDASGEIGKQHIESRQKSIFYHDAKFYSLSAIEGKLNKAGFKYFEKYQTLFGKEAEIKDVQPLDSGTGKGSFILIRAKKASI